MRGSGILAAVALSSTLAVASGARATEVAPALSRFSASLTEVPSDLTLTGAIYVPAYPTILLNAGRLRAEFSVTLSVHNTSNTRPLVLSRIVYYDGAGRAVQAYLDHPVGLKPFATIEIAVPITDTRAGTGANFLVEWSAAGPIAEPLAETVMLGQIGTASYSFVSQGRAIRVIGGR